MAAIPLDPNGKYQLSNNVLWQSTVLQAAEEKARDLAKLNTDTPPAWNVKNAKQDAYARRLMTQGESGNIQAKVFSLLARYDNPAQTVDPEDMNTNVLLLYDKTKPVNQIDEWWDVQAGINPGDSAKPAPNYPPKSEYEAQS